MDASIDRAAPLASAGPGRFTKVAIQTAAGEVEARLSEGGIWELRLRQGDEQSWRVACRGDLDGGVLTAEPARREALVRGPLVVDPDARTAVVGEHSVELSPKEFALLSCLAAQPERVFTKEELVRTVWDYTGTGKSRTLDSHMSRLRGKLVAAGAVGMIVNSWGVGYRLWDRTGVHDLPV